MRQPPDTESLWGEVKDLVTPEIGLLIIDDTTLDKPYSKHMDLVYRQWSGKHHQIVNGVNLETVVWTNNEAVIPVDFRIYDIDTDGKTKNDHFLDMLNKAEERGFKPEFVLLTNNKKRNTKLELLRKAENLLNLLIDNENEGFNLQPKEKKFLGYRVAMKT